MIIARQSTARTVTVGPVLDASGVAVTGGVVADFKISKNGGAPAALNGSATLTHRHTGHYSLALTATDLDTVGQAEVCIDDTVNACPVKEITVIEEINYDALYAASAGLLKFGFMMTDSTNHNPATGKTVSVTISKDGGAYAALNSGDTVTEIGNGDYEVDLNATDINAKVILFRATATACDDTKERIIRFI